MEIESIAFIYGRKCGKLKISVETKKTTMNHGFIELSLSHVKLLERCFMLVFIHAMCVNEVYILDFQLDPMSQKNLMKI